MKKLLLLFSLLVLAGAICYGQIESIRKLQKQLPLVRDSLRYVDALNRIGMLLYESDVDSCFYYTERARNIADRLQYKKGKADATNNLGIVYDMKGNLQLALRYYNDAYNDYKLLNDSADMVQGVMNIAMAYQEIGKDSKAIATFKNAIELGRNLSKDSIMSLVWFNYLTIYPDQTAKDSIPFYINKTKQIATKYHDTRVLLAIEQLSADFDIKNNERDKGVALLQQASADALKSKLNYLSLDILIDLGDIYAPTDSAKAISYYKEGLNISEQKNYRVYIERLSKKLYDFYAAKKDIPTAFYYSRQLINLHDAQEKIDNSSSIDFIEYALKDQQLASAKTQSRDELWFLFSAVLVCVLAIVILLVLWRNWNQLQKTTGALRLQFEQSESTMEALDITNKNYARLIKIVAHDLRNPISAISTISGMLLPDENLPSEMKELIQLIQVSSKNSLDLISDLLDTDLDPEQNSKMEAVNPDELLAQCIRLLSFRAKDKNQELQFSGNAGVTILGDYERLWRVMNNLIVNAIKFSPTGSVINIESRKVNATVLITVKDTGLGIPVEIQNKIFDPFTSAKRAGTDGEQPFGLGLYISKQIVEAYKGKIWLESEPGVGTTFFVELPVLKS